MRVKKLASILVAISLLFGLVGCSSVVDTTPPTTPGNISKTTPDNDNTPTFTWDAATDATSGIASYQVRIDSEAFTDIGNVTTYTVTIALSDGSHIFEVGAVDKAGNEGMPGSLTFAIDATPPAILEVGISSITETTAVITWTTDEPATSQVEYGESADYGSITPSDEEPTTNHSVTLTELEQDTAYHFRVKSTDEAGNEATSSDSTFTTSAPLTPSPGMAELAIHFIDVGQGDSILIDLGDIEVLIDGGGKSPGVTSYIDDYVDGALEVIVATHPHADHIGGLTDVLAAFEVQEIWHNGDTSTSKTYAQFMLAVNSEGAELYEARRGNTIEVGDLVFDVLHPVNLGDTTNNNSIVLSLNYGEIDFLFTGDAEQQAESSMLGTGIVPNVEILKVGHHGSRTASSKAFLGAVQPEVAIYMAGLDNKYGHPHAETIGALEEIGAEIYGTDVNGTIVVITDGITYEVQTEK